MRGKKRIFIIFLLARYLNWFTEVHVCIHNSLQVNENKTSYLTGKSRPPLSWWWRTSESVRHSWSGRCPSGTPSGCHSFPILRRKYTVSHFHLLKKKKKNKTIKDKAEFIIKSWNKIYSLWTALKERGNLVSVARREISICFLPLPFSFNSCSCTSVFCLLLLKSHFPSASVFSSPNFTLQK